MKKKSKHDKKLSKKLDQRLVMLEIKNKLYLGLMELLRLTCC